MKKSKRIIYADDFKKRIDGYPPEIRTVALRELRLTKSIKTETGYWIDDLNAYKNLGKCLANCSRCGYQMDVRRERKYHDFCPTCGLRMKGAKNG